MREIKELVAKANEQCKRIKDYIAENEGMFDLMNLKLYDASSYEYKDMIKDFPLCYADNEEYSENSYFCRFYESTYDQFMDWCAEEKIDFRAMCHHIGRTSSFYLYDKDKELVQREYGKINWSWTMYNIFNKLGYSNYCQLIEFDNEGNVDEEESFKYNEDYYTREEWIEELKPALLYIVNEMYNDFLEEFEDVKKVYEYIKDTKDNQVEYFKEWLEIYEADLQEEKDKRDKEMAKRNEIMNRSALNSDDLNIVLSCMN